MTKKKQKRPKIKRPPRRISPSVQLKKRFPESFSELFEYGEPDQHDDDAAQVWASDMADHIDELAALVLDDACHQSEVPTCWAPLHALNTLTALAAAAPAERLLVLFDEFDEWITPAAGDYFASIGAEGLALLRKRLENREIAPRKRSLGTDAFTRMAAQHPALKADIVSVLADFVGRTEADENEEEEFLSTAVIGALYEIADPAALPAIKRAFEEDRVAEVQLSFARVAAKLKGEPAPALASQDDGKIRLLLLCKACRRERYYQFSQLFYDGTYAEQSAHCPLVIPGTFTCSKCGVADQYDLSSMGTLQVLSRLMKFNIGEKDEESDVDMGIVPMRFEAFGKPMHPFAAMERYQKELAKRTDDAMHVGYGHILHFLQRRDEAREQYELALQANPQNHDALLMLGQSAHQQGAADEAVNWYVKAQEVVEGGNLPLAEKQSICDLLEGELGRLQAGGEPSRQLKRSLLSALGHIETPKAKQTRRQKRAPVQRTTEKIKPNDRCPCGSGKKYKKCCM